MASGKRKATVVTPSDDDDAAAQQLLAESQASARKLPNPSSSLLKSAEQSANLLNSARARNLPPKPASSGKMAPSRPSGGKLKRPTILKADMSKTRRQAAHKRRDDPWEVPVSSEESKEEVTAQKPGPAPIMAPPKPPVVTREKARSKSPAKALAKDTQNTPSKAELSQGEALLNAQVIAPPSPLPAVAPKALALQALEQDVLVTQEQEEVPNVKDRSPSSHEPIRRCGRVAGEEIDVSAVNWEKRPEDAVPNRKRKSESAHAESSRSTKSPKKSNELPSSNEREQAPVIGGTKKPQNQMVHPQVIIPRSSPRVPTPQVSQASKGTSRAVDSQAGPADQELEKTSVLPVVDEEPQAVTGHQEPARHTLEEGRTRKSGRISAQPAISNDTHNQRMPAQGKTDNGPDVRKAGEAPPTTSGAEENTKKSNPALSTPSRLRTRKGIATFGKPPVAPIVEHPVESTVRPTVEVMIESTINSLHDNQAPPKRPNHVTNKEVPTARRKEKASKPKNSVDELPPTSAQQAVPTRRVKPTVTQAHYVPYQPARSTRTTRLVPPRELERQTSITLDKPASRNTEVNSTANKPNKTRKNPQKACEGHVETAQPSGTTFTIETDPEDDGDAISGKPVSLSTNARWTTNKQSKMRKNTQKAHKAPVRTAPPSGTAFIIESDVEDNVQLADIELEFSDVEQLSDNLATFDQDAWNEDADQNWRPDHYSEDEERSHREYTDDGSEDEEIDEIDDETEHLAELDRVFAFVNSGEKDGACRTAHGRRIRRACVQGCDYFLNQEVSPEDVAEFVKEVITRLAHVDLQDSKKDRVFFKEDAYAYVFPSVARFLTIVYDWAREQFGEPLFSLETLQIVVPLMSKIMSFKKSITAWNVTLPPRRDRLVRDVQQKFISPLRNVEGEHRSALANLEETQRKQLQREKQEALREQRRQEKEERKRREEIAEQKRTRDYIWRRLHICRQLCEQNRVVREHLFHTVEPAELDANGDPMERVDIFHARSTPLPQYRSAGDWSEEQLAALLEGLQKYANPDDPLYVFTKIFKKYCEGRGPLQPYDDKSPLRPYNVIEITVQAAHTRSSLLEMYQSKNWPIPDWVKQIPVIVPP